MKTATRQFGSVITNEELMRRAERIQKAMFTTPDLGQAVSVEQADRLINLMTAEQEILGEVEVQRKNAAKWEEAYMDFTSRIMRPGVEGQRVADADRAKPVMSTVSISTVLLKGEVLVSREAMEDVLGGEPAFVSALEEAIFNRAGYDVEELLLNGDTAIGGADPYLDLTDGWLKLGQGVGTHVYDAAGNASYVSIFQNMLALLPNRYKRRLNEFRFWVPWVVEENFRAELSERGTNLGDDMLIKREELAFRQVPIRPISQMPITAGAPDTSKILLTHRQNLVAGFQRELELDSDYSKREGNTAFLVSCRVDADIPQPDAVVEAINVNAEPAA